MNLMTPKMRDNRVVPNTMLSRVRNEMERVFDSWFHRPMQIEWPDNGENWLPALDLIDSEAEITIKVDVPGMNPKDVNVSVTGNTLKITGKKDTSKEEKGENYYVSERHGGSFQRMINLPDDLDSEKINAVQTNGVLTIKIPKLKTAKPRHIPVKSGTEV